MESSVMHTRVNHPSYYTGGGIETIDFIEQKELSFNAGQVIKYVTRAGRKTEPGMTEAEKELEDLLKAKFYLERRIAQVSAVVEQERVDAAKEMQS